MMDVQAGPRIGHVLLSHVNVDNVSYFQLPGTPHLFEHMYDLVLFCHYNPFVFEKIDGTIVITLSIAMAKKAEKINIVSLCVCVCVCVGVCVCVCLCLCVCRGVGIHTDRCVSVCRCA